MVNEASAHSFVVSIATAPLRLPNREQTRVRLIDHRPRGWRGRGEADAAHHRRRGSLAAIGVAGDRREAAADAEVLLADLRRHRAGIGGRNAGANNDLVGKGEGAKAEIENVRPEGDAAAVLFLDDGKAGQGEDATSCRDRDLAVQLDNGVEHRSGRHGNVGRHPAAGYHPIGEGGSCDLPAGGRVRRDRAHRRASGKGLVAQGEGGDAGIVARRGRANVYRGRHRIEERQAAVQFGIC